MCLVRLKQEGEDGKYVYQQLVTFFWEDVETRITALGVKSCYCSFLTTFNFDAFH